ncbi:hypothetical protein N8T08_003660 [Aspergillus melleus]|uniref:Uncharacterized protein n=1 Tax=Aspergillus melleus TaxID=138277 RepID=A0ACC3B695_9EURO|nr:hypothetical protein N8T08_003660 [Aspergillus melleus]
MASSEHNLSSSTPARAIPNGWPRITESSPIRDLGPGTMDYERCAALHNELLTRAVKGQGGQMPSKPPTWWEARGPSEEVANSLHPSLIEFLKRAWDEDVLSPYFRLFVFLGALKFPNNLRDRGVTRHEWEDEEGRLVKLYESSHYRAADDEDSYLQMVDDEKAQVVSKDQAKLLKMDFLHGFMEPWIIHQYTKADLERATTAFKRLVRAIESRIPHRDDSTTVTNLPWHDPATFEDQSVLPPSSFAHEFLQSISDCSVRFRYVAPGIRFPTVTEFQDQPITDFITSPHNHLGQYPGNCPLRILQIDDAEHPQPVAHVTDVDFYYPLRLGVWDGLDSRMENRLD